MASVMNKAARRLPLEGRIFADKGVRAEGAAPSVRLSLRAARDGVSDVEKLLGFALPKKPKSSIAKGNRLCMWIGPDEWLIIDEENADLVEKFNRLGNTKLSAVDISHRNTAIILSGQAAADVLNSGCPQDLSIAAFPVGAASRTVFGKAEIVLFRETKDRFRIECWRSFSDYVWQFLTDAIRSR